jgi:hypothetical protein
MIAGSWLRIIWARRAIVVVTLLGVMAGALLLGMSLPKTYAAKARVTIDMAFDPTIGEKIDARMFPAVVWTQSNLVKDPTVMINAAKILGYLPQQDPDPRDKNGIAARNTVIRLLDRSVYVDLIPDSNILDITAFAGSTADAQKMADALRVAYINLAIDLQRKSSIGALKVMRERLSTLMADRTTASAERAAFERKHSVVLAEDGSDDFGDQIKTIAATNEDLLERQGQRKGALTQGNPAATARLDAAIALAQTQYGPNNPQVQALIAQRAAVGAATISVPASTPLPSRTVSSLMSARVEQVLANRGVLAEGRMLVIREYSLDDIIRGLAGRIVTTAQKARSPSGGVRAVGKATEVIDAVTPNLPLIIIVALVLGLLIGCQIAMIVEFLNRRIRAPEDLAECGPTILGVVGTGYLTEPPVAALASAA